MKRLIVFFSVSFLWGCTSAKLAYVENPGFSDTNFRKIGIYVSTDINQREKIEQTIAETFNTKSMNAVSTMKIVPPESELYSALLKENVFGIVYVGPVSAKVIAAKVIAVPATVIDRQTGRQATPRLSPKLTPPRVEYRCEVFLIDCATGKNILEFTEYEAEAADLLFFYEKLGHLLVSTLINDGYVIPAEKSKK